MNNNIKCSRCNTPSIHCKNLCRKCYNLEKHLKSPIISCLCGCGTQFHSLSKNAEKVKYVKGHQNIGHKGHNHKGGVIETTDKRIKILVPEHPFADHSGYVFRARLVLEEYYSKMCGIPIFILPYFHVHHKNEERQDDRVENLQILSAREHTTLHNLIDMSGRICSGPECIHPTVTKIEKGGYMHWYNNPEKPSELLCNYCYDKLKDSQ